MKLELLIPTSLDEIPLRAYQDFRKTVDGSNDEVFISEKMVSLFCGIELKDIVKIKATDLADMVEHFNRLFAAKTPFKQRFKIGDIEFGFVPNLETISWGEYIDAEKYLSSWENMHKAMAVLYRPITNTKGDKYEIMEYEGTAEFSELMKFTPVSIAMGASVFFLDFRTRIIGGFSALFGEGDEEDEQNDYSETAQFAKQWGWYQSIYAAAKGNILEFDRVTKQPHVKTLTFLTFEKQKTEIEIRQIKKQQQKW